MLMKFITTSKNTPDINGTCIFGFPMIGVFASFAGFNNPGKNAPKNDAYMNNIAHTNPGIAMPYAHVLLFPMLILFCTNGFGFIE